MTDPQIDPYSSFLGLGPGRRPPNYYELLQLELFCSHVERINLAVRRQFRLIKPYQDHPDRMTREAIQDVMNTITSARVVLTDPNRKESYDLELAKELNVDRDRFLAEQVAVPLPEFDVTVVAGPSLVTERLQLVEGTALSISSSAQSGLPLTAGRVADNHCRIEFVHGDWFVVCSPGRTVRVNDQPYAESVLVPGDLIDVGGYRLLFSRIEHDESRRGARQQLPPPLSLIIQRGVSIPSSTLNMLPPQRVLIGHEDSALWQLPDRTVSAHHCAVQSVGDQWEVEDLGSTNGTLVNGREVLRHMFKDRDMLTLGQFEILVSLRY